ncbi:MAG: radical SAM protein [Elusimicrobiota bacterium]|nr:radical SAM protein [Elusimicrobiota bacterium]
MFEQISCKTALNVSLFKDKLYASINPYIGCAHQCRYCYVQAEKYSKGNETNSVKVKINILNVLIKNIARYVRDDKYSQGVIYLGTSSDPYQLAEKEFRISYKILCFLLENTNYNIHIFTKSDLILEDISLFKRYRDRINISITIITDDEMLKKIFEPFSSSVNERLNCIKKLTNEGINCGCSIMPILPYITDSEKALDSLLRKLKQHNCSYIWWDYLTLRENITNIPKPSQKQIYFDLLLQHFPGLVKKYSLLYGNKFLPKKAYQKNIDGKIIRIAKKYSLSYWGPKWTYYRSSNQLVFKFNH